MNGATNVLGVKLSQLTTEENRVRLKIEPASINKTRDDGQDAAAGVLDLFEEPTVRMATVSMCVSNTFVVNSFQRPEAMFTLRRLDAIKTGAFGQLTRLSQFVMKNLFRF